MTGTIVCERPAGCGWWWTFKTTRKHWWSRPVTTYFGPMFENGDTIAARTMSAELFSGEYADCQPHMRISQVSR